MDSIYLHGSEDVARAANQMCSAAVEMTRAAQVIEGAVERQRLVLEDFLQRLDAMLTAREEGAE